MTKKEFETELTVIVRQKLGRGADSVVRNVILSNVVAEYVGIGINKPSEIISNLKNIKGAKKQDELYYNIRTQAQAGTREDRSELVLEGLDW